MEKFLVIKGLKLPSIEYDYEGDMRFFKALICYLHLFPQNVEVEEINDFDYDNPPHDKLVIRVSRFDKWDGYEIFYPVYTNIQCKYCSDSVVQEVNESCMKIGVKQIYAQLTSGFAQMIYRMFNIKIEKTKTLLEILSEKQD